MGLLDTDASLEKIINLCEINDIDGLKKYVKKKEKDFHTFSYKHGQSDLLVITILKNYSLEFIKILIDLYSDLNYLYCHNKSSLIPINYTFKNNKVSPLFISIAKNKINIANLLFQNNAYINYYNIFENLIDEELINIENLKFILMIKH